MTAHIHAQNMLLYAQDAAETDKPWERWEIYDRFGAGVTLLRQHPQWREDVQYRRKIKTIDINGYEVPEPVREPLEKEDKYFIADPSELDGTLDFKWQGEAFEEYWLDVGLIHRTKEAAELHAKALLSFTQQKQETDE